MGRGAPCGGQADPAGTPMGSHRTEGALAYAPTIGAPQLSGPRGPRPNLGDLAGLRPAPDVAIAYTCLLYTSDAADE